MGRSNGKIPGQAWLEIMQKKGARAAAAPQPQPNFMPPWRVNATSAPIFQQRDMTWFYLGLILFGGFGLMILFAICCCYFYFSSPKRRKKQGIRIERKKEPSRW